MTAEHEAKPLTGGTVAQTAVDGGGYVEVLHQDVSHYTKFIAALASAAGITFVQLSGTGNTLFMVLSIAIAIVAAISTYEFGAGTAIRNSIKFWTNIVAVLLQGVLAIVGAGGNITDITVTQWVVIGLSVLSAAGVAVLPNGPQFQQKVINVAAVTGAPQTVPTLTATDRG